MVKRPKQFTDLKDKNALLSIIIYKTVNNTKRRILPPGGIKGNKIRLFQLEGRGDFQGVWPPSWLLGISNELQLSSFFSSTKII